MLALTVDVIVPPAGCYGRAGWQTLFRPGEGALPGQDLVHIIISQLPAMFGLSADRGHISQGLDTISRVLDRSTS